MSAVFPVRVPRDVAERVREIVDAGLYPNRSSLIREALRRLVVSEGTTSQKATIRKITATVASTLISWNEKTVTDVLLFGSVARGQVTVESDVDLLVLVEDAEGWVVRQRLYDLVYPVILALGVDVSLIVVGRGRFGDMIGLRDPFALSIIRESIQLYGGFLDEYSRGASGKGC